MHRRKTVALADWLAQTQNACTALQWLKTSGRTRGARVTSCGSDSTRTCAYSRSPAFGFPTDQHFNTHAAGRGTAERRTLGIADERRMRRRYVLPLTKGNFA